MSSVAYAPHVAQSPTSITRRRPTRYDLLRILAQRSNPKGECSVRLEELARLLGVDYRTICRWRDSLITDGKIAKLARWFHRQCVYQILQPLPKPPQQEMSYDNVIRQAACFQTFTETPNKENKEEKHPIPFPLKNASTNTAKTGVWADLITWVKDRTGQLLADWQVGLIARDGKRAGVSLSMILQSLISGHHQFDQWKNAFAVLLTLARNAMRRTYKRQDAPHPQQPCANCRGTKTVKQSDGRWMFCPSCFTGGVSQ